jgi:hypothetical protein
MKHSLNSLQKKAARNSLEVEHILEAAAAKLDGLPEMLERLSVACEWSDTNRLHDGTHVIPFGRWAKVASAYCQNGVSGLGELLRFEGYESYVLALLETLHSSDAVDAIMELFAVCVETPAAAPQLAHEIAATLNQILCFKPTVSVDPDTQSVIRLFASALIKLGSDQVHRAVPVLLLRAVGDESSLKLLDVLPPFTSAWEGVVSITRRQIKRRLKAASFDTKKGT